MPGLSATDQSRKASKELINVIKNPGPQTPFMIEESQLHAIDRLTELFNPMQPGKTQTKEVHREVSTIVPTRVKVIVPPRRVPAIVTPPRVMAIR